MSEQQAIYQHFLKVFDEWVSAHRMELQLIENTHGLPTNLERRRFTLHLCLRAFIAGHEHGMLFHGLIGKVPDGTD